MATNETNNFISCGDVSVGGKIDHKNLVKVMKNALKDKTISNYLTGAYAQKKMVANNTMVE